jgi:hypothetical protein
VSSLHHQAIKDQTREEGYRPPYLSVLEERRVAREASAEAAAERMRADLPPAVDATQTTVVLTLQLQPRLSTTQQMASTLRAQAEADPQTRRTGAFSTSRRLSVGKGMPSQGTLSHTSGGNDAGESNAMLPHVAGR